MFTDISGFLLNSGGVLHGILASSGTPVGGVLGISLLVTVMLLAVAADGHLVKEKLFRRRSELRLPLLRRIGNELDLGTLPRAVRHCGR